MNTVKIKIVPTILLMVFLAGVFLAGSNITLAEEISGRVSPEVVKSTEAELPIFTRLAKTIFTPRYFEPHRIHFFNNPALLWLLVFGNGVIALAYMFIPAGLIYFVRKKKDIVFSHLFWLYSAFIFLCGSTHIMMIIVFWYPVYWLEMIILWITGIISMATFFSMIKILPQAMNLKSPEFIFLASHQLKTPPTAIKLLTERLLGDKMGTLTEKQKEYIGDIRSSNQRMIDLVNTLLNVSRIELGSFIIQVSKKDACTIVQSVLSELKFIIDKRRLKLKTIFPEKNVVLMLDEPLFHMVINNLVINAVHYTAEGGDIQVECKMMNKRQTLGGKLLEENCFVVVISDTGCGIPQRQQSKIFTKLFRADNALEKHTDGTGLGLYVVKSILDHSGGSIWFTSRENEGSTFYVAIPAVGMRAKAGEKELIG